MMYCHVLIGTPTNYRPCMLKGDPCQFHAESGGPRTEEEMRDIWVCGRLRRPQRHKPRIARVRVA